MRRKCTDEEIVQCFESGKSLSQIAKDLGCSLITVKKALKENGLDRTTVLSIEEVIAKLELQNISKTEIQTQYLSMTMKKMAVWFSEKMGVQVSENMAYRILKHYKIKKHTNSLLYINDERAKFLVSEWDEEKNGGFDYSTISVHSKKLFWWQCALGHSWKASIGNRYRAEANCHICTGRVVLKGFNDFATLRSDLLLEWNFDKNIDIHPTEVSVSSGQKAWWICEANHEWQAKISNRTKAERPTGCPYCAHQKVLIGINDLRTLFPEIAKEWHPGKNSLKADEVFARTNKQVWWLGKCGHEWEGSVAGRTLDEYGCPYCSGKRVLQGFNDLATTHLCLEREWAVDLNVKQFNEHSAGSQKKVWWRCAKKHVWQAVVKDRCNGNGCPFCANRLLLVGFNDLATTDSDLMKEWDYEKNILLKPEDVMGGSKKKVWWKCSVGHSWQTQINYRTHGGTRCPTCFLSGVSQMEKDLTKVVETLVKDKSAVQNNSRMIIPPKELDIYLPDLNIAIEFNGNYWHSDDVLLATYNMTADEYHSMKRTMCEDKGIALFFVWEHDWCDSYEEVVEALDQVINHRNFVSPLLSKTSYDMELTFQ